MYSTSYLAKGGDSVVAEIGVNGSKKEAVSLFS
jgi:hypothetical protein